ncbi:hypothetical protein DWB77_00934 [Streptomyces hundungensis]|uniref:Uncharacterized protein n=1 Tax=Streptomyces hundungensis TaxID=1077946 RepID=A0A387H4Z6_9ACTN|nr:hypothetical protein DWB77_00934 [Streptomyces hundungensis]
MTALARGSWAHSMEAMPQQNTAVSRPRDVPSAVGAPVA